MGYKILIADDDPDIREFIRRTLTKAGHKVSTASNGVQAVEMAGRKKYDLILCDIIMPDENGIETLGKLKKLDKKLSVVMISGAGTHDLMIEALEKGAADFIAKPASIAQLNHVINKVLNPKSEASQETASPVTHLMREGYLTLLGMINKMLEVKNPYMRDHANNVAECSRKIAIALKLPEDQVEVIYYAGILHDIGKVGVNDNILLKPAKLNASEWVDMKLHSVIGRNMVEQVKLFRAEEPLILHHHERYDGSGYPEGLDDKKIPLGARIISIADAYDAMTSIRPYRKAMDSKTAQGIIKDHSGTQFDPEIAEVFLSLG